MVAILVIIVWLLYGKFSAEQYIACNEHEDNVGTTIMMVAFAPLVLLFRVLYGIVSKNIFK